MDIINTNIICWACIYFFIQAVCVLLHGDAAFSGQVCHLIRSTLFIYNFNSHSCSQGIVAESLALADLPGFTVGILFYFISFHFISFKLLLCLFVLLLCD